MPQTHICPYCRSSKCRATYKFIKRQRGTFRLRTLCRVLDVAPRGYYAWLKQPMSDRAQEDARLLRLIRASFIASQGIYGAPRVFLDLRAAGESCSKHRVARLMREHRLRRPPRLSNATLVGRETRHTDPESPSDSS